jgi:hypothetical protein
MDFSSLRFPSLYPPTRRRRMSAFQPNRRCEMQPLQTSLLYLFQLSQLRSLFISSKRQPLKTPRRLFFINCQVTSWIVQPLLLVGCLLRERKRNAKNTVQNLQVLKVTCLDVQLRLLYIVLHTCGPQKCKYKSSWRGRGIGGRGVLQSSTFFACVLIQIWNL